MGRRKKNIDLKEIGHVNSRKYSSYCKNNYNI